MKHLFYLLFGMLFPVVPVFACGPFDRTYLAEDYYMFRLLGDNMKGNYPQSSLEAQYRENCEEWAKITSRSIPLDDIKRVVYKWSIEQLDSLRAPGMRHQDNSFARWIVEHQDNEVIDFLLLAKRSEWVRATRSSKWYYPVDGDEESLSLDEISRTSLAYTGERLKDRYLLQAIRALFAMSRFDTCIELWKEREKDFRTRVIKELAANYIYGACERVGDTCLLPELPLIREMKERHLLYEIQRGLHGIESYSDPSALVKYYQKVAQVIQQGDLKYEARWHYAKAFLADRLEKREEAMSSILEAKAHAKDTEIKSVVRILEIYLRTKYAEVYDPDLENYLYRELSWLDHKITDNLTTGIQAEIRDYGDYNHICGYSQYYWNDMLRKIVIGNVVPLCIKSDYKTRALQYLNMADNGIFNKVPQKGVEYFESDTDWCVKKDLLSWEEYRNSLKYSNDYDYRNDFFINLDSIGVKYVERLAYRMANPISPLDSFLNKNSYIDPQYLYDIIGTQLIAERKYKEAAFYLAQVSEQFQRSRNVASYFNRDPFPLEKRVKQSDPLYKLRFAEEMSRLESDMRHAADPNVRAESMLRYARGMQNSVGDNCWVLTSYYRGEWYGYPFYGQNQRRLAEEIVAESRKLKEKAFSLFTDDERAAKAYQDWCMWATAVKKYPDTKTSKRIRGHCDNLVDYQLSPSLAYRDRYD